MAMWPQAGVAQLAPTGGHYAARASDTGTEPGAVNGSGGYSASVPLELPAARGDLPVPLSIGSGARGVGAVGLGWDVALSYVRRDTTFAHRKPRMGSDVPPAGREQVTLSLQGQLLDLLPKGSTWISRYDAQDLVLQEQSNTWVMYDGRGRTWTFTEPAALSGSGFWLLSSITGADNTAVQLEYDVATVAVPGGSAATIDLRRVLYNKHPQSNCFKHELVLNYGAPAASPLSLSLLGDRVLTRLRTLSTLDVGSRASCGGSLERLRTYTFAYQADADTQQPRLVQVALQGRQGTPEQSIALPVSSFTYGSATTGGKLTYALSGSLTMPAGANINSLASTAGDGTFIPPVAAGNGSTTWQNLIDLTGDGLPDMVYARSGKLWIAHNRPGTSSNVTLGNINAQLQDTTFVNGAFETRSATQNRFTNSSAAVNIDKVWRQAIDVNGDGRLDIVDASEAAWKWVVYLNTPGTGTSGIKWERRAYAITPLYNHLLGRGHSLFNGYLPLSSRFSGHDRIVGYCWRWSGTEWTGYPQGFSNGLCGGNFPNAELSASPEKTYTDWEVKDINADGFPDLVFNSSRVDVEGSVPAYPGTFTGEVINTQRTYWVRPLQGSSNNVEAVLNLYGLFIEDASPVFSSPITLKTGTECGVGLWATTSDTQQVECAIADVNGDGLVDRVENKTSVKLGTGRGFTGVTLTLPGPFSTQKSAQYNTCFAPEPDAPGSTPFTAWQMNGLRDLTGDGIPDFASSSGTAWTVAVGTGAGFAPAVTIEVTGGAFTLSNETERCDGASSLTLSGLYDINGDGKPDLVRLTGRTLEVFQLSGGTRPGKPEAGRILRVDNGYGALTTVGYRSAKEDGTTKHQVPFPEIVVSSVTTVGAHGLGGSLSTTAYAYGGAELTYDSALHAFSLPGYQRSVAMNTVTVQGKGDGYATITDTYPLPAFNAASKEARFGRYLQAGKVRDVTTVTSSSTDPWTLLATDLPTYARRLKATHLEWVAKIYEETTPPGSTNTGLDCFELAYPLDFLASWNAVGNTYNTCTAHGFLYARSTDSWHGSAAPPSTANVVTRSEVTSVDDFGRVLNVKHSNDVYRTDDDLCEETLYATPTGTGTGPRVLHAPMSRRLWTCDKTPYVTYASESWRYDGLAQGSVSAGHLTSHSRDRRDTATGALLNTVDDYTTSYDVAGNLSVITRVREDGATQTVKLGYDDFGLALQEERVDATGLPALKTLLTVDPVSLATLVTTDANLTQYGVDLDGFGRQVRTTVKPPGEALGVMSTTAYVGFAPADAYGRRITGKTFIDPVPPGTEASAPGAVGTVFLDELGRARRTESALGTDYANTLMVTRARTYDDLGRVAFEADPYPTPQNAASAYGTTYFFNLDGSPSCSIRGNGPQAYSTTTDLATERIPTCYSRSFADHLETVNVSDASSLTSTSPQAGVIRSATMTAGGRVLSRSTVKGTARLEHATLAYDRLGQLTGMTRYLDPVGLTGAVTTAWTYDSFGQRLQWQEPGSAVKSLTYSNWGEPLEVTWYESVVAPAGQRTLVSRYDALGRVTHTEDRIQGVADPDTAYDYLYDVGASPTSLVTPTNVLGRLSQTKSSLGEVYYSYDPYGRSAARVFTDDKGTYYVEKSALHANGLLGGLTFQLPDTGYAEESAWYSYDSARRMSLVKFEDPSTSLELFLAKEIDPFGRVRKAIHGGVIDFEAGHADVGRRLQTGASVSSAHGSRAIYFNGWDAMERQTVRTEVVDGVSPGVKTNTGYDVLGRLASSLRTQGSPTLGQWQYTYNALGNVLTQNDLLGTGDASMSYGSVDRDQLCGVGYAGTSAPPSCNVTHDSSGNVLALPSRNGGRSLTYFPSGATRILADPVGTVAFRYGALDTLRELDLRTSTKDARHTWWFGDWLERKEQVIGGKATTVLTRHFPGPGGIVASRRGYKKDWIFPFGEMAGARYMANAQGEFIQDMDYQPFGDAKSSGPAQPGSLLYSSTQWNGGEALEAFGLSQLGARLYDPVLGRFLSRDPLFIPRTAATTNPYAFAMNDPVNLSDPSGMDSGCIGHQECSGGGGGFPGFPGGGGGPSQINDPSQYLPHLSDLEGRANPQATVRPPKPTASFSQAPTGPPANFGIHLKVGVMLRTGIVMDDSFNFDTLAWTGHTLDETIELVLQTQQVHAQIDAYNANLDQLGSFAAGFGDSVWFWCPGCGAKFRQSFNIQSGDADGFAYGIGTLTGIIGSLFTPHPISIGTPSATSGGAPSTAAPASAAGGSGTVRVGRWMSEAEHNAMQTTGKVQESLSGTTHVAYPATPDAYMFQARPGSHYVEFNVPISSIKPTQAGWAKIPGPQSLEGRLAARKGLPLPEMPSAMGIEHRATKLR
ncbi:hypothetical protein HPP06_20560 [Corallococcus exiguus]|nr:hypothetical protein [Corallococcus exiguus]